MTLIQASICNNGKAIILIGDRMVSIEMGNINYEHEAKVPKLYYFDKYAIGFAGSLNDIKRISNKISKNKTWKSVVEFADYISNVFRNDVKEQQELIVKYYTLKDIDDFINDPIGNAGTIPEELKAFVYGEISEVTLDLAGIIVGFDELKNPKIFDIDNKGIITDSTDNQYSSLGSGEPFSEFYFDQHEYDANCSLELGLFLAFRAKKAAEYHPGVGCNTDIYILKLEPNQSISITPFFNETDKIKILDGLIKTYTESVRKLWAEKSAEVKSKVLEI